MSVGYMPDEEDMKWREHMSLECIKTHILFYLPHVLNGHF